MIVYPTNRAMKNVLNKVIMKNIIILLITTLITVPLLATTNIKVCNHTDSAEKVSIYVSIVSEGCADHNGSIAPGDCNDWNVHGCNRHIKVWFSPTECMAA